MVLAGGEGKRLMPLTSDRAKPAVPFGGIYRLVDFVLSNLANGGYLKIVVLTQYKSHSLDRHITRTWRMSSLLGNYVTPVPAQQRRGPRWFAGSADAIFQNLNLIEDEAPEHVIVFGADHIYRMDPRQMMEQHIASGAGVTVAAVRQPRSMADQFGVIETDAAGEKIDQFLEKPKDVHRPGGLAGRDLRVDGQLHLPDVRARQGGQLGRDGPVQPARPRRQHHPEHGGGGAGVGLRLLAQRGARPARARTRVLARRRDPGRVLRRPHGPDLGQPRVQPLQPRVADLHAAGPVAAGPLRRRNRRRHRPRGRVDDLRRRPGGRLGRALRPVPGGRDRPQRPGRGLRAARRGADRAGRRRS